MLLHLGPQETESLADNLYWRFFGPLFFKINVDQIKPKDYLLELLSMKAKVAFIGSSSHCESQE